MSLCRCWGILSLNHTRTPVWRRCEYKQPIDTRHVSNSSSWSEIQLQCCVWKPCPPDNINPGLIDSVDYSWGDCTQNSEQILPKYQVIRRSMNPMSRQLAWVSMLRLSSFLPVSCPKDSPSDPKREGSKYLTRRTFVLSAGGSSSAFELQPGFWIVRVKSHLAFKAYQQPATPFTFNPNKHRSFFEKEHWQHNIDWEISPAIVC